jgi:hypothetical protein
MTYPPQPFNPNNSIPYKRLVNFYEKRYYGNSKAQATLLLAINEFAYYPHTVTSRAAACNIKYIKSCNASIMFPNEPNSFSPFLGRNNSRAFATLSSSGRDAVMHQGITGRKPDDGLFNPVAMAAVVEAFSGRTERHGESISTALEVDDEPNLTSDQLVSVLDALEMCSLARPELKGLELAEVIKELKPIELEGVALEDILAAIIQSP